MTNQEPTLPPEEMQRLNALPIPNISDFPLKERFDRLTRLAACTFKVAAVSLSLLDHNQLVIKSAFGLAELYTNTTVNEVFSTYVTADPSMSDLIVGDMEQDSRFRHEPGVSTAPFVRFYAACQIKATNNYTIGILCLIDHQPREFSETDRTTLHDLSHLVENELNSKEVINYLNRHQAEHTRLQLLESVVVNTNDAILITEAGQIDSPGPRIVYSNPAFTRMTGYNSHEVLGRNPRFLQGLDTNRQELERIRNSLLAWQPIVAEVLNYRKNGTPFWAELSIVPMTDNQGWYTHWISVQREVTARRQNEQIRRENNDLYRTLARNLPDTSVFIFDRQLRYKLVEGQVVSTGEFSSEQLQGHTPQEIWPSPIADKLQDRYQAALNGLGSVTEEVQTDRRHYQVHTLPVSDQHGQIFAGIEIERDINEVKWVESSLRRQNDVLEFLASGAPLGAVLERLALNIEEQSEHKIFCSILLLDPPHCPPDPNNPPTQQILSVMRLGTGPNLPTVYNEAIDGIRIGPMVGSCGTAAYLGQTVIAQDIETDPRWENYRELALPYGLRACWSTPVLSQTGLVLGTFAVYYPQPTIPDSVDVQLVKVATHLAGIAIERKRAEESLEAEKQQLAVTLKSIADGVITTDAQGRVVLVNTIAEHLTGWTQAEAAGQPLDEIFRCINEVDEGPAPNPIHEALASGQNVKMANHRFLIARDGTRRLLEDSAAPIRLEQGGPITGAVLIFRDITHQAELEREVIRAQKIESVGLLAGGIAHDFNNMLTAIMGNISLARLDLPPDANSELDELLGESEKAVLRARDLTQQLLTFARGGTPIKKANHNLPQLIREAANFALRGSRIQSKFKVANDLWAAAVDEGQLNQVIQNLVINAQQAMPQGGTVTLIAQNLTVEDDLLFNEQSIPLKKGSYISIMIEDEGSGIASEHLLRVFDPYFTTKPKGHGLGLASAYSIIKNHSGLLTVQSKLGAGTTFYIYLPALPGQAPLVQAEQVVGSSLTATPGQERVLMMEDDPAIGDMVLVMLKRLGYQPVLSSNGSEAVKYYHEALSNGHPFALVILDLTIPGGPGGEAILKMLQKLDPFVRAVVSSGYSNDPVMAHYRDYGFEGVVTKPYRLEELGQVLKVVLKAL